MTESKSSDGTTVTFTIPAHVAKHEKLMKPNGGSRVGTPPIDKELRPPPRRTLRSYGSTDSNRVADGGYLPSSRTRSQVGSDDGSSGKIEACTAIKCTKCDERFCTLCRKEDHGPASCVQLRDWKIKVACLHINDPFCFLLFFMFPLSKGRRFEEP